MEPIEIVTLVGSGAAIIVSVYNAYTTSQNLKRQQELAKEKLKDDHQTTSVSNTEKLQDMYQQAFGDFETLWKKRLADQEAYHEEDLKALREKLEAAYKQKEEILAFRIADLKGQVERLHGVVEGATGRNIQAIMKRSTDYRTPDPIPNVNIENPT